MVDDLVRRLSEVKSEVIIGDRGESNQEIEQRIKDGYIHLKFTQTKGGTELGINVDFSKTNFNEEEEVLHIEGITNLNYHSVRCVADINLTARKGEGILEIL